MDQIRQSFSSLVFGPNVGLFDMEMESWDMLIFVKQTKKINK